MKGLAWLIVLSAVTTIFRGTSAGEEGAALASMAGSSVVAHPLVPTARASSEYSLSVGTTPIPVQEFKDIHYAHFSFAGRVELRVSVGERIAKWSVSPRRYEVPGKIEGEELLLSISQPRKLVVRVNDGDRLFIFADAPEADPPRPGDPGVVSVLDFGVDNSGGRMETARIQAAIAALPENGTLYFPAGIYLTGTLTLKSNMTLYLAGGCLIQGSGNVEDYTAHENDRRKSPGRLLLIDRAENVTIEGRGVVDANGGVLRREHDRRGRALLIRNSRDVLVQGVILRDSPSWNTHVLGCERVTLRNVKLLSDLELSNTDGFDLDASSHVLVEDCFAYCSDDAAVIKCAGYDEIYRDVTDIVVRGNVFLTKKSALKVGTESRTAEMKDITFESNDVLLCDRGMSLYCNDGATYSNIRFINNRFEECYPDRDQCLLDFDIRDREGKGHIRDVLVRDCVADIHWPNKSTFRGHDAEHIVSDVRFENFMIAGRLCRSAEEADLLIVQHAGGITFSVSAGPEGQ